MRKPKKREYRGGEVGLYWMDKLRELYSKNYGALVILDKFTLWGMREEREFNERLAKNESERNE